MDPTKTLFCVSDLHLHDTITNGSLFTKKKEAVFVELCKLIIAQDAQLLFAGDVFDLTGTRAPATWLGEFFDRVYPGGSAKATADGALQGTARSLADRIDAICGEFPGFVAAITALAKAGRLSWIPGNHDWELFTTPGIVAFSKATAGLAPAFATQYFIHDTLIAHGNQFDSANLTNALFADPNGWMNRGATITAVLYHALYPALRAMGVPQVLVDQIPGVRPEDGIVDGLQQMSVFQDTGKLQSFIGAFARLLYHNGFPMPAIVDFPGLAELVIKPEELKNRLKDDGSVDQLLADKAQQALDGKEGGLPLTFGVPKLVVMGHTHDLDPRPDYLNLGTWIDHVSKLGGVPDISLPFVRIEAGAKAMLYEASSYVTNPSVPPLWRSRACQP